MMFIYQAHHHLQCGTKLTSIDDDRLNLLKMIKIAVLGDIGSGKTFISKLFKLPIFNADKEVIQIYKSNKQCFYKLRKKFKNKRISFPINKKI